MSAPSSPPAEGAPRGQSRLSFAIKALVSLGLLGLLLAQVPFGDVASQIARARGDLLLLSLVVFAISVAGSAYQWGLFLRAQGIDLPLRSLFEFYFVGLFFSNFLPGNIGGDVVKVVDIHRAGGTRGGAIVATLMDRAMGLLVLVAGWTGAAWYMGDRHPFPEMRVPVILSTAALALAFAVILSPAALAFAERVARRVPPRAVGERVARLLACLERFHAHRSIFAVSFVLSIGIQILRISVHYLAARALGISVAPEIFLLVVPAIAVAVSLPISVGGFGVREGLGVLLFGRVGVGAAEAFAFELISHLVAIAVSAWGGLLFLARRSR